MRKIGDTRLVSKLFPRTAEFLGSIQPLDLWGDGTHDHFQQNDLQNILQTTYRWCGLDLFPIDQVDVHPSAILITSYLGSFEDRVSWISFLGIVAKHRRPTAIPDPTAYPSSAHRSSPTEKRSAVHYLTLDQPIDPTRLASNFSFPAGITWRSMV